MGLIKSLGIGRSVRVHMFFFDLPSDANAKYRALYLGLCGDSHELKRAEEHCVPKRVPSPVRPRPKYATIHIMPHS